MKALYDYDAAAPGELSIREDEILMVFDREDDWILVQSQKEGGKVGFIPGNYVEEVYFHLVLETRIGRLMFMIIVQH